MSVIRIEEVVSASDIREYAPEMRDLIARHRHKCPPTTVCARGLQAWGFIYDMETSRFYLGVEAFGALQQHIEREGESA